VKKILVVDDDVLIRAMVRKGLEGMGYDVEVSSDGDRALTRLKMSCYDLVITDLNMPNMSGLELIRTIRSSDKECNSMPILCITADDGSLKPEAIEAGATGWVEKPFNPGTWAGTLSKMLGE
jgi:two-component system chemotaxis response regulator CheY